MGELFVSLAGPLQPNAEIFIGVTTGLTGNYERDAKTRAYTDFRSPKIAKIGQPIRL